MRFGAIWLAVVAMLSVVAPCYALDQRDLKNCDQSVDWDRKIAGCTKLLAEPRFPPAALSTIHAARGTGWAAKNDFDRAIVDFNESLRLDPNNLVALSNRGAAWLLKGETTKSHRRSGFSHQPEPKKSGIFFRPRRFVAAVERIRQVDCGS